ncbi:MAG: hypothetical protein B7733_13125 [Myxococcales bacterium FL481]|nr:MAG: hypothetical protein B7733_13125 [Myxococcales bacterium FL481]
MTFPDPIVQIATDEDFNCAGEVKFSGNPHVSVAGYNKLTVQAIATEQAASTWVLTLEGANIPVSDAFTSITTLSGNGTTMSATQTNNYAFVRVRKTTAADARGTVAIHGWLE